MELYQIYYPLSSNGFHCDDDYFELSPSPALAPYVRCFWGTLRPGIPGARSGAVIPDTCMDLIFRVDYAQNSISSVFCALDDAPYIPQSHSVNLVSTFGIRFYAWSAACFSEDALNDSMRMACPPERFFSKITRALMSRLFECSTLAERAMLAEEILLKVLRPERIRSDVQNALYAMITARGNIRMTDVASAACLSPRQLERRMREVTGAPPKLLHQLIRYQMIYRELLEGRFSPQDAVEQYGFSDQSHLLREFRRFHGMSPAQMLKNHAQVKNVGIIL